MKKIIFLLIICNAAILVLNSCNPDSFQQVVSFDIPKENPQMVSTVKFNDTDTILNVYLSATVGANDAPYKDKMDKAAVKLYKNNALFVDFKDQEQYSLQITIRHCIMRPSKNHLKMESISSISRILHICLSKPK